MNGRSTSQPPPVPGPFCAVYAPLLPLLNAQALPPEQEALLREHLADCAWCQNQLAAYAVVEDAVRRRYAALPSAQPLTMEDIMRASQSVNQSGRQSDTRPAAASRVRNRESSPMAYPPEMSGAPRRSGGDRRRPTPWATLGAVAAALLLVALAAALFAELRSQTPTPGGVPTGSVPATSVPAASCATALQGATPATAIPGFSNVTFPTGAVMTTVKSSLGGPSQFTVLETDVCYSGVADDLTDSSSGHHSVTANLLAAGWSVAPSFPYQGALLQSCPSQCYQMKNTRHLALEQIADHGNSVFTYHLRLATPPSAPSCNANFSSSPLRGVQTSVEDVPLPPITYVVPDNAAGLRGYDLCSSGTAASITAFLTSALPATGWSKVASDARCFYADQCWTKHSAAISWHVDDPTDWLIAYHPAAA